LLKPQRLFRTKIYGPRPPQIKQQTLPNKDQLNIELYLLFSLLTARSPCPGRLLLPGLRASSSACLGSAHIPGPMAPGICSPDHDRCIRRLRRRPLPSCCVEPSCFRGDGLEAKKLPAAKELARAANHVGIALARARRRWRWGRKLDADRMQSASSAYPSSPRHQTDRVLLALDAYPSSPRHQTDRVLLCVGRLAGSFLLTLTDDRAEPRLSQPGAFAKRSRRQKQK
jgi:hypothetical protein